MSDEQTYELQFTVTPPNPGEVLRRLLFADGTLTQDDAAKAIGVSRYSVNQLVNDRRAITAEMALRLAKAVGTTPEFWLDLQRNVDLFRAYRRLAEDLKRVKPLRKRASTAQLFYKSEELE